MKRREVMVKVLNQATPGETIGVASPRVRDKAVGCVIVIAAGAVAVSRRGNLSTAVL
jgi:hypothetical protein